MQCQIFDDWYAETRGLHERAVQMPTSAHVLTFRDNKDAGMELLGTALTETEALGELVERYLTGEGEGGREGGSNGFPAFLANVALGLYDDRL